MSFSNTITRDRIQNNLDAGFHRHDEMYNV
jgi:hypothetical protein